MVIRTLKRALYFLVAASGVALALAALFLLTQTVQKSDDFDRLQDVILAINIAGGMLLFALLIGNHTLITGDLVRAHRGGSLMMLPADKLNDVAAARASVAALAEHSGLEAVLVGDGWPVFRDGHARLAELVASF